MTIGRKQVAYAIRMWSYCLTKDVWPAYPPRIIRPELPGWAAEIGVTSWAQMFLKFALSNDAVTAVIPATGKPERQSDNLQAGFGPLLDAKQKAELVKLLA